MRCFPGLLALFVAASALAAPPPVYLWYEAEWFDGVEGTFSYWTGTSKPTGHWGVAGPGVSPEWTQGGESEWNSTGVPAAETNAECHRDLVIPRAARYRVWVRYVDHRKKNLDYTPVAREKPPFAYLAARDVRPAPGAVWRGSGEGLDLGGSWKRPALSGRDFSLWTGADSETKWWAAQKLGQLTLADVLWSHSPPPDIRKEFHKQFPTPKDAPLVGSPLLLPGFYLGNSPDLSPDSPLRKWLTRTKTPFYILTNYAAGSYTDKTGPATYAALTGPLAELFVGYVHGEAVGTGGVSGGDKPLGKTRAEHLARLAAELKARQAKAWTAIYKTPVPDSHWEKGIPCLSVDSIALAHLFHDMGSRVVGYEVDSTNFHVPMRIAFQRGAARQYGGAWINYASGNFGDACNYFTQEPQVPRGAKGWYSNKYAVTDGVTACWYRKLYYLNYLGGASAIFWEQSLANQYLLPGPGTHPVGLSPFGRATEDFMAFVGRLPGRGEPLTPVALLLSHAHGYEPVNYSCKMLNGFPWGRADTELRELFNACWYPAAVAEGRPASPDVQSMPSGIYGNIFDVLVDRPARARAVFDYPVVWAAGDVDLGGAWPAVLEEYVRKGGTLVVNVEAATLPAGLLGLRPTGKKAVAEEWRPEGGEARAAVPFEVAGVELDGAKVLAWAGAKTPLITRHAVGAGAVVVSLVPRMLGQDERAHPAVMYLLNGLTAGLLPVEVRRTDGSPLRGEVMYQVNKTKDGYLVLLVNNRGVDKTPNGVARVDRRAWADVVVQTRLPVTVAREYTEPRDLAVAAGKGSAEVRVRIHPGDVQVVYLTTGRQ
jgi:hypothetical protein